MRSYGEFLGLDGEELVGRYRSEVSSLRQDANLSFLAPTPESKVPGGAVFLASALVAALAYGSWYYISSQDRRLGEIIPDLPDRLKALVATEDPVLEARLEELEDEIATAALAEIDAVSRGADPTGEAATAVPDTSEPELPTSDPSAEPIASSYPEEAGAYADSAAGVEEPFPISDGQESDNSVPLAASEGAADEVTAADIEAIGEGLSPDPQTGGYVPPDVADSIVPEGEESPLRDMPSTADPYAGSSVTGDAWQNSNATATWQTPTDPAGSVSTRADTALTGAAARVTESPAIPEAPEIPALTEPETTVIDGSSQAVAGVAIPSDPSTAALAIGAGGTDFQTFSTGQGPRVYGEATPDTRIVLRATLDCWVQVRDSSGTLLLTRVLRPGDSYNVPNQPGLTLLAGNAGGLEVLVDGLPIPRLGPVGAVRRDVPLEPGRLRNGTAQAPRIVID